MAVVALCGAVPGRWRAVPIAAVRFAGPDRMQPPCRVHPVVLFTITDAFIRRNDGQERVIGTLLGSIVDGVVEVKSCYAVPHSESTDSVGGGRRWQRRRRGGAGHCLAGLFF